MMKVVEEPQSGGRVGYEITTTMGDGRELMTWLRRFDERPMTLCINDSVYLTDDRDARLLLASGIEMGLKLAKPPSPPHKAWLSDEGEAQGLTAQHVAVLSLIDRGGLVQAGREQTDWLALNPECDGAAFPDAASFDAIVTELLGRGMLIMPPTREGRCQITKNGTLMFERGR